LSLVHELDLFTLQEVCDKALPLRALFDALLAQFQLTPVDAMKVSEHTVIYEFSYAY
jgi:hypothetical protein